MFKDTYMNRTIFSSQKNKTKNTRDEEERGRVERQRERQSSKKIMICLLLPSKTRSILQLKYCKYSSSLIEFLEPSFSLIVL
jgi:hypothetical protein